LAQVKASEARQKKAQADGDTASAQRWADVVQRYRRIAALAQQAASLAQQATAIEEQTAELNTQTRRARNLLEQTEVRRARALGELQRLGITPPAAPSGAAPAPNERPSTAQ